ncbi:MAG: 2-oxoacid:acceptor oxidoreductase subunit alpha [Peptococcaceae bacterium]|jgi:2-oxoglutarate ferredoxin oxidoreductase subunit alpha|nr:2-oxoacid:acceptor oxidoreductase subunit alpha [Peptococcaceae bacterium]MDH7525501.1 2-oxoacid:acceptor oxidoreductase subunit alpha [Peptococcaceae bacterium]
MKRQVKLLQGNEACAMAAVAAGVRFFAGYPITPATEIAEIMAQELPKVGGTFIQMEDEIASMAAVIGASIGGVKSLTATSGPGFTLKQENLGYAAMVQIPCVIVNVQRGGPSTGMPTLPAQMDVMQARWGTHGDHPIIVLCPSTVYEFYMLTIKAVNFSEMLRTPVIILSDAVVGHLREKVVLPDISEIEIIERKKVTIPPEEFLPFKPDPDDVPPFVSYGKGYRYHMTSNNYDEGGYPATNNHQIADKLLRRLHNKIEKRRTKIVMTEEIMMDDAEVAIFAFGCTARSAQSAVEIVRAQGWKVGLIKALTLWPFPREVVEKYGDKVRAVIVPEMNMGQLVGEVERALKNKKAEVRPLNRFDGKMITPEQIVSAIKEVK